MPPFRTNIRVYRYKRPPHPCSAQDLLNDDDLTHLKLEEKCCNNGCLIVGLLSAEDELRPIIHDAKRLKAEASKRGNHCTTASQPSKNNPVWVCVCVCVCVAHVCVYVGEVRARARVSAEHALSFIPRSIIIIFIDAAPDPKQQVDSCHWIQRLSLAQKRCVGS